MDLNSIYTELIMEHNSSKHNKGSLDDPKITERGHNPNCGDDITLELKIENDIIENASYTGIGCAISQASTSMMIDLIKGKTIDEALKLVNTFMNMIRKDIDNEEELEILEDAIVLQNISNMPARVKCAVLAWHALKEAISSR